MCGEWFTGDLPYQDSPEDEVVLRLDRLVNHPTYSPIVGVMGGYDIAVYMLDEGSKRFINISLFLLKHIVVFQGSWLRRLLQTFYLLSVSQMSALGWNKPGIGSAVPLSLYTSSGQSSLAGSSPTL